MKTSKLHKALPLALSLFLFTACSQDDPAPAPTKAPVAAPVTRTAATPTPTPAATSKVDTTEVRELIEKSYDDLGWALTRSDIRGSLAFYNVPFRQEDKELNEAQLKDSLKQKVREMNAMAKDAPGTLRFSSKTEIQKFEIKGDKVVVDAKNTLTARVLRTKKQVKTVHQSTDVWKQVKGKWKLHATSGIVETRRDAVKFSAPPPTASKPTSTTPAIAGEVPSTGPKEAYLEYLKAIEQKDHAKYASLRGSFFAESIKLQAEMDAESRKFLMDRLYRDRVRDLEITGESGGRTEYKLTGTATLRNMDGELESDYHGSIVMVVEDGKWKVNKETWAKISF